MEEAPAPDPFLAHLDADLVNCLLLPVLLGDLGTRALGRQHPQMPELLADIAEISGLTLRDMAAVGECSNNRPLIAREFVLRPARLHAFMALGMALWNSPLRDSPFLRFLEKVEGSETGLPEGTAEWLFDFMEDNEERQWVDFPADFEPAPAFLMHYLRPTDAVPDPAAERAFLESAPDVRVRTGEELRWQRLQLESVIGRAGEMLRDTGEAERIRLMPDNPSTDDADADPDFHDYYHSPCVDMNITSGSRAMMAIALLSARNWHFFAMLPFARAASQLRWLRRQDAVEALRQRIDGLTYANPLDLTTSIRCTFSLAELLTLYHALESLALAAISDLLPVISGLQAESAPEGSVNFPTVAASLTKLLDVSHPFGQLFYRNVSLFAQLLRNQLTDDDDDREELAQAHAEVAALAELATSEGAV